MKAVVLARGLGSRMKAPGADALDAAEMKVADSGVKSMMPVGDRPFLDYILASLADAGCTDICLVIGPEHDTIRRRYLIEAPPQRCRIHFAIQEKPLGTGDAVLAARAFAGRDEFLTTNSDNYYPLDALRTLVNMSGPGTILFSPEGLAAHSNIDPARIMAFALGRIGEDGALDALVEKPTAEEAVSMGSARNVSMNLWRFSSAIFEACRDLTPSRRGELELTNAIMKTIEDGVRYKVLKSEGGVLDLSNRGDVAAVRQRLSSIRPNL